MERKRVAKFRKAYNAKYPSVYIFTDRDSPGRMHRSGWDFLISNNGKSVFVEAKESDSTNIFPHDPRHVLGPYQCETMQKILKSGGTYVILIFYPLIKIDCVHAYIYHHSDIYNYVSGAEKIIHTIQELLE